MACLGCGGSAVVYQSQPVPSEVIPNEQCEYNKVLLTAWKNKLECFKRKHLYSQYNIALSTVNSSIGIVLSALNYESMICYFKRQLDGITDIVNLITSIEEC